MGDVDAFEEIVMKYDAFEEIVMKYQKRMFNISYRMLGDYNEAAEAVQDAFVSVFRNIKGFRGESGLFTWISAIVVSSTCPETG
jgi:RNA polymerase sigma-70 factor (ECF subfamily)